MIITNISIRSLIKKEEPIQQAKQVEENGIISTETAVVTVAQFLYLYVHGPNNPINLCLFTTTTCVNIYK